MDKSVPTIFYDIIRKESETYNIYVQDVIFSSEYLQSILQAKTNTKIAYTKMTIEIYL